MRNGVREAVSRIFSPFLLIQQPRRVSGRQGLQLTDRNLVQPHQTVGLGDSHADELGVHALDVGQHQQLLDGRVIAHVAVQRRVGLPPLFGRQTEQRDVQHVGLVRIGDADLLGGQRGGYQVIPDGVRVDSIVQLGQRAVEVPGERQAPVLVLLEPLEFLDQEELELDRDP